MADISSISVNIINQIQIIGGTYKEITFDVFDVNRQPVDISSFSLSWIMSPFGKPNIVSLTKPGVFRTDYINKNRFTVYLHSADTIALSGKYVHQPVISGNTGYDFRLGQGLIEISPANG